MRLLHIRPVWLAVILLMMPGVVVILQAQTIRKLTFEGVLSKHKIPLGDFTPALPADWSKYSHLVIEMRTSSPQRFSLWLYRTNGTPVRLMFQPSGQRPKASEAGTPASPWGY